MIVSRFAAIVFVLLTIAGCSQQPASQPSSGNSAQASPAAAASATVSAASSPRPTGPGIPEFGIPAKLHGQWGLVPGDCTSTRGDAKGLLTVSATSLGFYESRGTLSMIGDRSDTHIRASFAFSGEGMLWNRDEELDLQDDGKTLIRREYGEDAAPGPFKYTRCPA